MRAGKQKSEANLSVEMKEQSCGPVLEDFAQCAKDCDPNVANTAGGGVSCEAGKQAGRCSGKCTGTCTDTQAAACKATCQGKCQGKCTKGFFGKCGGKCIGSCDMAKVNGKCKGNCDGQCLSEANGTCEGKCEGKCQGACVADLKKAECSGTCSGSCSEKMSMARCDEIVAPPELAPECSALCTAQTAGKLSCSGGFLEVAVFSAKDQTAAESLRASVAPRLKEILSVGDGMYPGLEKAAVAVKTALEGLEQTAAENEEFGKKAGDCIKLAQKKQEAAGAAFAKLHDVGQALYQAVRN